MRIGDVSRPLWPLVCRLQSIATENAMSTICKGISISISTSISVLEGQLTGRSMRLEGWKVIGVEEIERLGR